MGTQQWALPENKTQSGEVLARDLTRSLLGVAASTFLGECVDQLKRCLSSLPTGE